MNPQVKAYIDRKFDTMKNSKFRVALHVHDGTDGLQIDPKNLLGFPVITSAPTDKPLNGTIRLYLAGSSYRIYAFISGTWVYRTLNNT